MSPPPAERGDDAYKVFWVHKGKQEELAQRLRASCTPLLGSNAYVNNEGTIFYYSWPGLSKERFLPEKYVQVSDTHPKADIYAPHTRYGPFVLMRINEIKEDEGSVETAIRAVEHILRREEGRERDQATTVAHRAHELYYLFSTNFSAVTPEEFEDATRKTYALLAKVNLNPETILSEEKQKMTNWLTKGGAGRDTLDRINWLISIGALSAAYRKALERQRGIGTIVGKYIRMREALIFERDFSRTLLGDVALRIDPTSSIPLGLGELRTLQYQVRQPRVKTYRTTGRKVEVILQHIEELLKQGNHKAVVEQGLFAQAHTLLIEDLDGHKDIYPKENH